MRFILTGLASQFTRSIGKYPQFIQNFQRALTGETFSDIETLDSLVLDTRYTPLTDTNGNILGVIGVSTDITDQKKAEEALAQTEALFRVCI
jgi:PAS domain-containing protein